MTLELTAIPLALVAGIAGVLSPCVWPLVPVVTSSAAAGGRSGPYWLAGGLSLSFAVAGSVLTLLLVSTGLDPELFRYVSAALLIAVALFLLVPALGDRATRVLSSLSARIPVGDAAATSGHLLQRWRGAAAGTAKLGKRLLGWSLVLLGGLVLTGLDKALEAAAVGIVPDWVFSF